MSNAWDVALIRAAGDVINGAMTAFLVYWLMRIAVRAEINRK